MTAAELYGWWQFNGTVSSNWVLRLERLGEREEVRAVDQGSIPHSALHINISPCVCNSILIKQFSSNCLNISLLVQRVWFKHLPLTEHSDVFLRSQKTKHQTPVSDITEGDRVVLRGTGSSSVWPLHSHESSFINKFMITKQVGVFTERRTGELLEDNQSSSLAPH